MNQPHKPATTPVAAAQSNNQAALPAAPKPPFVPPKLIKQGSVATLTQDFGDSSIDPGPLDP